MAVFERLWFPDSLKRVYFYGFEEILNFLGYRRVLFLPIFAIILGIIG
jgi:hypothetical protein